MEFSTLIVFPTSRSIRQYINLKKDVNSFLDKTISIGDFFSKVIISPNKTLISKDLRILYLKEAILQIDIKKLGLSSNFSKFYTQSEYIFKFFNELNSEFKNVDDLNDADTYAFYLEHLDLLNKIYIKYNEILNKNNFIDSSILPTEYKINGEYLNSYENIIINYEGYFSGYEFEVIKEISKITNVKINMVLNEFNTKNIDLFKSINIDLEINNKYTLDISNETILVKEEYASVLNKHSIYPVKQRITQISFIKHAITNMIKSGIEPNNIAVVLPDENFNVYLKLFDNENYFNFAMGNNIYDSHTMKFANAINANLNKNEPKDDNRLEYFNIDIDFINNDIKPFWNNKVSKEQFFNIIDFISKDESNADILDELLEIKLSLNNLLFNNDFVYLKGDEIKLKDAYKIFLSKLGLVSLDDTRSGKITVIGILETRSVNFDGVIVIDFNDDKVPKRSIKDKFISTRVKQNASLPTLKHREDLQKYYYKRLFDTASQISISYVNDESNTISRFSTQLFEKINVIKADFSNILEKMNSNDVFKDDIKMEINLSKQEWSATSLKSYLECKRKYYYSYILRIREHGISLKPKNYELGKIIHDVLESIYKNNTITYVALCDEINKYQNKNPYLTLELEIWKRKLKKFIESEEKRFTKGISVHSLEKSFNFEYKGIKLKGAIDRIDKLEDNTYAILDYKTSSSLKIDTPKTVEYTNDFQLEFYYLASRDLNISQVAYYDLNNAQIKEEVLIEEKLDKLDNIFLSLNTKSVNFAKCEDKKACLFCIYKVICNRE